jgi:predicted MFS family arabinose efflux permease
MPVSRARLGVIFLTVLIDLIGFGIVLPILPYLAQRLGASGLGLGILMGAFSGMQFVSTAFLGRFSDTVGRRPILLLTMVINAAGYILFALAGSYPLLLLARLISGLASGNISVAQAYIADISAPAERSKAMGTIGAAFGIGFVIGPAIGGLAAHALGPEAPGFFAAGLSLLNLVLAWRILPESLQQHHRRKHNLLAFGHLRAAIADPRLRPLLAVWAVVPFAFAGFSTIMPLHTSAVFGWHERELGLAFTVIGVVAAVVQGWAFGKLATRLGDHLLLIVGAFGMAAAIACIPFLPSSMLVTLWMAPLAAFNSLFAPAATGMVSILADASEQGTILGAAQALAALGRLGGPAVFGQVLDMAGAHIAYVAVGGVMLLGGVAALMVPRGAVLHKGAPKLEV